MCMHARMRRLVWSGGGTYVRRRRPWPARGKICACAFLVIIIIAERISARQYKSGSILGIYVRMYVCIYVRTYVRSSAQAQALRRVRARAYTV